MQGENRQVVQSASSPGDELNGEVALKAHLDRTGLTVAGRSRFLAATDRLFGGLVGIPAAFFEGKRVRREIKENMLNERARLETADPVRLLRDTDLMGTIASKRVVEEEIRKQLNCAGVWTEAVQAIQQPQATGPSDDQAPKNDPLALNDDWLNVFVSYAEKASSDELRQLWGRVLTGQVRKPGSFSPSTLRIMSEVDTEAAVMFQSLTRVRFSDEFVLRPQRLEGTDLMRWVDLEECGLLQDAANTVGGLNLTFNGGTEVESAMHRTDKHYLKITFTDRVRQVSLPIVKITKVGQQIAKLSPWDELGALIGAASRLLKNPLLRRERIGFDIR